MFDKPYDIIKLLGHDQAKHFRARTGKWAKIPRCPAAVKEEYFPGRVALATGYGLGRQENALTLEPEDLMDSNMRHAPRQMGRRC